MTEEEIARMDVPANYKKRDTIMNAYLNIIYKMLRDGLEPADIMSYIIRIGYNGNWNTLESYIALLAKNNFGIRLWMGWAYTDEYPKGITVIKRNALLMYITTKNTKVIKDETIAQYLDIIKEKYKIVTVLERAYDEFYTILMGKDPERMDGFIKEYEDSAIKGFIEGIKKDVTPVKNAISHNESSGFVEGNNNKFKLIKRILYGRANLATLFKKSYVAFKATLKDFKLSQLIQIDAS